MNGKLILTTLSLLASGLCCRAQLNVQDATTKAAQALSQVPDVLVTEVKPNYWTKKANVSVGFTNTMLTSWAAGGNNSTTLASGVDASANYKKNLLYWNNRLQLDYGFLYAADKPFIQKNKDRIYFETKFGYQPKKESKWSLTTSVDIRSQFSNTYNYVNPGGENPTRKDWIEKRTLQSGFLSPAYTNVKIGLDWNPKQWISISFSPLTGSTTIVTQESLRKNYGMSLIDDYQEIEEKEGYMYRPARFQFGATLTTTAKFSINKSVTGETQLVLFSDYINHPENLRVNWDNKINWQLAKYFSLAFQTWLIYDPDVLIGGTQKVQFKEFLTLNFAYSFTPRR